MRTLFILINAVSLREGRRETQLDMGNPMPDLSEDKPSLSVTPQMDYLAFPACPQRTRP